MSCAENGLAVNKPLRASLYGCPRVEIDYSGFQPYLIYAELGLKLPNDEPYEHSQFNRPEMKSMFLVMINC